MLILPEIGCRIFHVPQYVRSSAHFAHCVAIPRLNKYKNKYKSGLIRTFKIQI